MTASDAHSVVALNERSREIFRHIVDAYLETGEPVGSRTIARKLNGFLSLATIRNVMADLEYSGLLFAPHTSAGRLPTEAGLRMFVSGLLQVGGLNGLSPTAMLPGDFRGDVRLESEISRAMTAEMMTFSNCKDSTKFAIVDIKAQGVPAPANWTELWTAEACGKFVTAYVDYAASKGAIDVFTQGLAREVAAEGVRVSAVRPGITDTGIHATGGEPDRAQQMAADRKSVV